MNTPASTIPNAPTPATASLPKYIRYLQERRGKHAAGTIIELKTVSFLISDKPLPIKVTMGYDRPTNRDFLYIEPMFASSSDYSSPLDNCTYNSLFDPQLSAPCRGYFLKIFIKYTFLLLFMRF
jgi:hypothetical protein